MKVGTYDFYFDISDKLEALGVEFCFAIREPGEDSSITLTNIRELETAKQMMNSLDDMLRNRFNPNPEEGDSDDPNTAPGL